MTHRIFDRFAVAAIAAFLVLAAVQEARSQVSPAPSGAAPVRILAGGTVVNPRGVPRFEEGAASVIRIDGSRITEVGREGEVEIPDGAEVIDVTGRWIVPGLIDAHVHFFQSGGLYTRPDVIDLRETVPYATELARIDAELEDTFARYLRCGITSVVDVGGPMWNFEVRERAARTAKAPRVAVAGPLISTYQPAALTTDDPPILKVDSADEARALVRKLAARKPDLVKIWYIVRRGESPQDHLPLVEAAIEESHALGYRVAVHATELETARLSVQAGADVLVHSVSDRAVDPAFIELLRERGVIYTTTIVVREGYQEVLSRQVSLTDAELSLASPRIVSTLFDLRHLPPERIPARFARSFEQPPTPVTPDRVAMENLKRLHKAGVIIAAGTDAGNIGTLHGPSLFREMELMAASGLTPLDVLTAATLGSAQVMGREEDLGSIEAGKLADLVILDTDPRARIPDPRDIRLVMKGGLPFEPGEILEEGPEDVVQRQVNAYNARDLDAFLAAYAPDAVLETHPGGRRLAAGHDEMRTLYGTLFESAPDLHCEILERIVQQDFVIDHERVTGRPGGEGEPVALAMYEVRDGLIRRVWFLGD